MTPRSYPNPQALRRAVTDRLRNLVGERLGSQLTDLQRQFAYDRLLCRVFTADPEGWVLKGAVAMLARLQVPGRHTKDIDLYRLAGSPDEAERALRTAAGVDLGDYFRFTLGPGRPFVQGGTEVRRVPVEARLGVSVFAKFSVDLVTGIAMTAEPEKVSPLIPIEIGDIGSVRYRAYPVVDHIADKVFGVIESHPRRGQATEASTRYRDLADLAVFAHTATVDAEALLAALKSEASRRGLVLPTRLVVPAGSDWTAGYRRVARDAPGLHEQELGAAVETASRFLDPVLGGKAHGRWEPESLSWSRR